VEVLRRAPAGDPRVYRIDGVEVGLRNETAKHIYLKLLVDVTVEDEVTLGEAA
jgi:ferrous iron transport protein A